MGRPSNRRFPTQGRRRMSDAYDAEFTNMTWSPVPVDPVRMISFDEAAADAAETHAQAGANLREGLGVYSDGGFTRTSRINLPWEEIITRNAANVGSDKSRVFSSSNPMRGTTGL